MIVVRRGRIYCKTLFLSSSLPKRFVSAQSAINRKKSEKPPGSPHSNILRNGINKIVMHNVLQYYAQPRAQCLVLPIDDTG